MAQPAYQTGATRTPTNYNFVSSWEALAIDSDTKVTRAFGKQRLSGIMDLYNLKTPVSEATYRHYEDVRNYPKIQATTGGAGAGAAATFTTTASAEYTYIYNHAPFNTSVTTTDSSHPVIPGAILLIRPASGTVSAETYIKAIVTTVTPGSDQFSATPIDSTESIPAIASAQEIVIIGFLYGEGSNRPDPISTRRIRRDYNIAIKKMTKQYTNFAQCQKTWYYDPDSGLDKFSIKGEENVLDIFLNSRELYFLLGEQFSNVTLEESFAATDTPILGYRGLIPSILAEGNELNYSSVTGLTLQDLRDHTIIMDKQVASMNNLLPVGISLSSQIDEELGDRLKNGGVTYGMFTGDQAKKVSLDFQQFTINEYKFNKTILQAFNDVQSLGADGYAFPDEGMIIPMDYVDDGRGNQIPTMRMRYLVKSDGTSQELQTDYWDGRMYGDSGQDYEEVRYTSYCGPEFFALNRFSYIKKQ